jgi:hypothetical protein
MIRLSFAAFLIAAMPALAHDHWSDLDGDGFLEPDEFNIGDYTFQDIDANSDGVISVGEYEALELLRADDGIAVPEEALPDDPNAITTPAETIEPRFLRVGE